jgi:hypothetical protein
MALGIFYDVGLLHLWSIGRQIFLIFVIDVLEDVRQSSFARSSSRRAEL